MNVNLQALRERIKGKRVLNFKNTDFIYPNYKDTIQDILREEYFPEFKTETLPLIFQGNKFQNLLDTLRTTYPSSYQNLFKQTVGGNFGPGEILSYFVTKTGTLSGRAATGDLKVGSTTIEVKSVRLNSSGQAFDIRTGSVPRQDITNKLYDSLKSLAAKNKLQLSNDGIQATTITQLRKVAKDEFEEIERDYVSEVMDSYFNKFHVVLFNDATGEVIRIFNPRSLQYQNITIYRFSQKQFSCSIKL